MNKIYSKQIGKVIKGMRCPERLKCCKPGIKKLCETKKIGIETFLVCFREKPQECKNAVSFGNLYVCECPLRYYVRNKLPCE